MDEELEIRKTRRDGNDILTLLNFEDETEVLEHTDPVHGPVHQYGDMETHVEDLTKQSTGSG